MSYDDQKEGRALEKAFAEIEDKLKNEWNWYETHVDQQVNLAFHKHVKPFCRARKLRFNAGMGTWAFFAPGEQEPYCKERPFEDTEEWDRLCDLLAMEVPGMDANDLGSLMTSTSLSLTEEAPEVRAAELKVEAHQDKYGRVWPYPKAELCPECGQPDSCGDCNHKRLPPAEVLMILFGEDQVREENCERGRSEQTDR